MSSVTPPRLSLNGTAAETLLQEYEAASEALQAACEALKACTVHVRDYGEDFAAATVEHCDRINQIRTIRSEIMQLWEHVQDQKDTP